MRVQDSGHGKSVYFTKEAIGAVGRSLIISGSSVLRTVSTMTGIRATTGSLLVCVSAISHNVSLASTLYNQTP
jgi:hypothetical protein